MPIDDEAQIPIGWSRRSVREMGKVVTGKTPPTMRGITGVGPSRSSLRQICWAQKFDTFLGRYLKGGLSVSNSLPKNSVLVSLSAI